MDNNEKKILINKKSVIPAGAISVGVTHVDGKIIFKHNKKWANTFFSVCHYSKHPFALTPSDFLSPTMVTTISVDPSQNFCEKSYSCLDFTCKLNKFSKDVYLAEFKDIGSFSLGLPQGLGDTPLWFSINEWGTFWAKLILQPEGGILTFNDKEKDIGD